MNLNVQVNAYKKSVRIKPDEEKIRETIIKSKEAFFEYEDKIMLSYYEFLWSQLKLTRKKWWILQTLLLCLSGMIMLSAYEDIYIQKSMGIMASLFIILVIPEFWKNRSYQCMEIEEVSYYSLRQIYSARMVLFGTADILLLTVFMGTMTIRFHFQLMELVVQFLLPMLVTACICFGILCSKHICSEIFAVSLCVIWSSIWSFIVLNEKVYAMISLPVWLSFTGIALIVLCVVIFRTIGMCDKYWEVVSYGNEAG